MGPRTRKSPLRHLLWIIPLVVLDFFIFRWLALRPGTFIPREETDPQYGLNLLGIGVHRADVAQAHLRALQSDLANEAFITTAGVPFTREESDELLTDARAVILRHFPQAEALEAAGHALPISLGLAFSVEKARRLLGYEPEHTFGKWLEGWVAGQGEAGRKEDG
nr:hypothetical protein [Kiritimatiellia bacterium]